MSSFKRMLYFGVWALIWLASSTRASNSLWQTMTSKVKACSIIWVTLASWGTPSRKYWLTRVRSRLALPM